ncbi:MAG: hypothetical protein KatS3mg109_1475 [Pirellulaceae bacterium]|nr:MAG: hypothetical protein KatS3mg109_1475 [Pirellulaceae bacterium]GIW93785.1 MAG: hypothetical protein KatS3mg110_1826 [Pirellulaceae bacterium]
MSVAFLSDQPAPDNKYVEEFRKLSIDELVQKYNNQVGIRAWTYSRGEYLHALYCELKRRKIDLSEVSPAPGAIQLTYPVEYDATSHKLQLKQSLFELAPGKRVRIEPSEDLESVLTKYRRKQRAKTRKNRGKSRRKS